MDALDETHEMYQRREGKRPVFVLVLCILTWVGSFLGLISGTIQLYIYSAMSSVKSELMQNNFPEQNMYGYLFWSAIATIMSSLLCSLGAFFMFRLKKIGFFIYLAGQIIPLIVTIYSNSIFLSRSPSFQSFTIIGAVTSIIFPIAFIAMYGVHLKQMK